MSPHFIVKAFFFFSDKLYVLLFAFRFCLLKKKKAPVSPDNRAKTQFQDPWGRSQGDMVTEIWGQGEQGQWEVSQGPRELLDPESPSLPPSLRA